MEDVASWKLVHLDLDVELYPRRGELRGCGTAQLRRIRGPSSGPTLTLGNVSRFTKLEIRAGHGGTVEVKPHLAQVRFKEPLQTGAEVELTFEFRSGGDSCPVVVSPDCAYARCVGSWHPQPRAGSATAPGTTRLHVPAEWRTLSNGTLTETRVEGNRRTDTWSTAVPAARSFAAGPYAVRRFLIGNRTYGVYLLDADEAKAETYGKGLARALEALETRFGPYPYEACSIVEVPKDAAAWRGASEHGFIVAASHELQAGGFNLALIAHEVAHHWWGDFVGTRNPAAQMVDEALAEYGVFLALEVIEGEQVARDFLWHTRADYVPCACGAAYFDLKCRHLADKPLMQLTGEGHDYWLATAKGRWVYHMLRRQVGDEVFFGTLRQLIARHGGREMSLADLREAFLETAPSHANLAVFFRQWLDRPGAPLLDVDWADASSVEQSSALVGIRQTGTPYELRLEIALDSGNAVEFHTVQLTGAEHYFLLHAPGKVTGVRVDPSHQLLLRAAGPAS